MFCCSFTSFECKQSQELSAVQFYVIHCHGLGLKPIFWGEIHYIVAKFHASYLCLRLKTRLYL